MVIRAKIIRLAAWAGVALMLQCGSVWLLLAGFASPWTLPAAAGVQLVAAWAAAFCALCALPLSMQQPRWQGLLFGAAFVFFLPVGGQVILFASLMSRHFFPVQPDYEGANIVRLPSFEPALLERVQPGAGARARMQAATVGVPMGERLAAMAVVRGVSPRASGGLLTELLSDSQDEIRLLAYGAMDTAENRIMRDIAQAKARLEAHRGTRREAIAHAHLAELYWEFVYQRLARGEVRRYTLPQVVQHATQALVQHPRLAGMHYLLGRCALEQEQPQEARAHFLQAQEDGMARTRIAPWMAEAFFQERRWTDVSFWVRLAPPLSSTSEFQAAMRFWQ